MGVGELSVKEHDRVLVGYLAGSLFSALFCLWILLCFWLFPKRRRHPTELLIYRVACDLLISINHIWSYNSRATFDTVGVDCTWVSIFNQFAYFASDVWYLMLSVDLLITIKNPFTFHQEYAKYFHICVWGSSFTTTLILGVVGRDGRDLNYICWVEEDPHTEMRNNLFALYIYYILMFIVFGFSIYVIIVASKAFRKGLPDTIETRRRVLLHSRKYVFVFVR